MLNHGCIDARDMDLFNLVDTPEEVVRIICKHFDQCKAPYPEERRKKSHIF
jgi:predicted Rossmann-fold nucleotide-binding protein